MAEEQPLKSYRGNCHCGAFIFDVKVPEIKLVNGCNCSLCRKKGYLFTFPGDGLTIVKGEGGTLQDYTFNEGNTKHHFCPTCGTPVMCHNATFPPGQQTALNVRTIQDFDISKLERKSYECWNYGTPYTLPKYDGPEPTTEIDGAKLYTGGCHCGAVTLCVKTKPLDSTFDDDIVECNCSICQRAAYIWIYPRKSQVVIRGGENMTHYVFGTGCMRKGFCKTCGVQITNERNDLTDEQVEALPAETRAFRDQIIDWLPISLRVLHDFELDAVEDVVQHLDGWNDKPLYVNP